MPLESKGTLNLTSSHSALPYDPHVISFLLSPPESDQPGPICLYKQEAEVGDGSWPWWFCFSYIPLPCFLRPFNRGRLGGELY